MTEPFHPPSPIASQRLQGILLIALSATGFGAMAIFARLAYADGADLFGVLITRFGAAGALLLTWSWWRGASWPSLTRILQLALMGGVGYVGMSYCYFAALNFLSASLVALLLYTYPIIVALLAAWFLGEQMNSVKYGVLLLCLTGTSLIVGANGGDTPMPPPGVALAIGAAVIYAAYITVGARIAWQIDPLVTTSIVCLASAAVLSAIALVRARMGLPPHFPATWQGWGGVAGIAVLSTVVAVNAFFAGLKRLGASQASMLSTLEPLVTVVLAAFLLSEALTGLQYVGGAAILTGVLVLARLGAPSGPPDETRALRPETKHLD